MFKKPYGQKPFNYNVKLKIEMRLKKKKKCLTKSFSEREPITKRYF